jgi:hypothetical protein
MPTAIITALIELVQLGISVGPQVVAAAQTAISLIESGTGPTAEQQAQIDAALDAAHAALQAVSIPN